MSSIGQKIKDLVYQKKIYIPDLAKKLKITKQGVYAIFNKENINTELLQKIADVLGVHISYFFGEEVEQVNKAELEQLKARVKELEQNNKLLKEFIELLKSSKTKSIMFGLEIMMSYKDTYFKGKEKEYENMVIEQLRTLNPEIEILSKEKILPENINAFYLKYKDKI